MTQLSMNPDGVGTEVPASDQEFELLPDLLEELERTPRETVLALLRQKYGPGVAVQLTLKKGAFSEGFSYTTRCPFHFNANKPVAVLAPNRMVIAKVVGSFQVSDLAVSLTLVD